MSPVEMIYGLEQRHRRAEHAIQSFASGHRLVDGVVGGVVSGASSFLFIPFLSNAASLALMSAQVPLVYRPLSRIIAAAYLSPLPDDDHSYHEEANLDEREAQFRQFAFQEKLNAIQNNLFGIDFILEIFHDVLGEILIGNAITAIPFIGAVASIAMDAAIAATMTWRIGVMTAIYCCNFEDWLESRKATYELSKKYVGPLSPQSSQRVDINSMFAHIEAITAKQVARLRRDFINTLVDEGRTMPEILDEGLKREIPGHLLRELLKTY